LLLQADGFSLGHSPTASIMKYTFSPKSQKIPS